MEFVSPLFLYGLIAISIPIIIHLFNFRRFKKVYFTNLKYLFELKEKTKKKSQLKHLIVLLLRILAIASLVLAFSRPFIPVSEKMINLESGNALSVYIDNSFSLETHSSKGVLIEEAKNRAIEISSVYKASDKFQLLTNDFEGRHQHFVSRDEFVESVREVNVSPAVRKLSEVNKRQNNLLSSSNLKNKTSYLISDFQKNISDLENFEIDSTNSLLFLPLVATETANLFIDSCWFDSPVLRKDQNIKLHAIVKNSSEIDYEKIPVKLIINNNQKALASIDISAGAETEIELSYTIHQTGIQYAVIEITDYPVTYDDKFYFSYSVSSFIPVLCINGEKENLYLNTLFGKDSAFIYTNISEKSLDYSSFNQNSLIILNELQNISSGLALELNKFITNGGHIIVLPAPKMDIESYNEFIGPITQSLYSELDTFNVKIDKLNFNHPVFNDVFESVKENMDMPEIFAHYPININTRSNSEILLPLANSKPYLSVNSFGRGKVYLSASPFNPDFVNFSKYAALFVPTLYKIAILSNKVNKLYYLLSKQQGIELNEEKASEVYKIKDESGSFELIPEIRTINSTTVLFTNDMLQKAGNYTLSNAKGIIQGISMNYDRIESDLRCYSYDELETMIAESGIPNAKVLQFKEKPLVSVLEEMNNGIQLWKLFVLLALLFLALEVILLRIL